ncbi:MAG: hypothetical protein K0R31_698 [Clostridiales bacterium]|jgi:YidC/Oxa1 family membrane protein insertase|nr:hypothetical protein [Clostridiales bacterium]
MFDPIARVMGTILNFIYTNIGNYGIAIIIFTIIIKLILLPLTIKQYRSTAKMQEVQPQIQEIQKRYKNDKEKLNQEMMRIYQENKVNPAGGCLPLLVQMPILFSLYYVISQPLKFMVGKTADQISQLVAKIPADAAKIAGNSDISIINYFSQHKDELVNLGGLLKPQELLNMNFLGLNLGLQPTFSYNSTLGIQYFGLLLIPILAAVTTFISVKYTTPQQAQGTGNDMSASMTKSMSTMMPLMTAFFAFSVPAGLGLYWIASNIIQIFQQMYLNKFVLKKKEVASK